MLNITFNELVNAFKTSAGTLRPTSRKIKKELQRKTSEFKKIVQKGEAHLSTSTKRYGGNPLPWEPGGERYFKIIK